MGSGPCVPTRNRRSGRTSANLTVPCLPLACYCSACRVHTGDDEHADTAGSKVSRCQQRVT